MDYIFCFKDNQVKWYCHKCHRILARIQTVELERRACFPSPFQYSMQRYQNRIIENFFSNTRRKAKINKYRPETRMQAQGTAIL